MARMHQDDFDESVYLQLAEFMAKARNAGKAEEEIDHLVSNVITSTADTTAPGMVQSLYRTRSKMLKQHTRMRRRFERRLRTHWGRALDTYYMTWVCMEELGSNFNDRERPGAVENEDLTFEVVCGLHARACRTSLEIFHLLSGGFPLGALSRCRTLHEIAVTAMVMTDYGRRPECRELAERFKLHNTMLAYEDAKIYQEHAEAIKHEPFTDEEMETLER